MGNEQSFDNDSVGGSTSTPNGHRKRSGERPELERPVQRQKTSEGDVVWWRDDPKNSFSDWMIEICNSTGDPEHAKVYHVHRLILARGARKSSYFVKLFQNGAGPSSFCKIELNPLAASAFPCFLDYIYGASCNRPLEIKTQTATALHSLGMRFGVSTLCNEVEKFCLEDISLQNASWYYRHAITLKNSKIRKAAVRFLSKYASSIDPSSPILKYLDSRLCEDLLRYNAKKKGEKDHSLHMSKLLAAHCLQSAESLDIATFRRLTDPSVLPSVDPSVALTFAKLEEQLAKPDAQVKVLEDESAPPLQERCVAGLSKTWKDLKSPDEETRKQLVQQNPHFLVELLVKSLTQAENELKNWASRPSNKPVRKKNQTDTEPQSQAVTPNHTSVAASSTSRIVTKAKGRDHLRKAATSHLSVDSSSASDDTAVTEAKGRGRGPHEKAAAEHSAPIQSLAKAEEAFATQEPSTVYISPDTNSINAHCHQHPGGLILAKQLEAAASQRKLDEIRHQKERFLMFLRILVKCLETRDPVLWQKVNSIINECAERNKLGEKGYESPAASIRERLKHVVGDYYWKEAESLLAHFLAKKKTAASGKPGVGHDPQPQQQADSGPSHLSGNFPFTSTSYATAVGSTTEAMGSEKGRFRMFLRVLLKNLETNDPIRHQIVKDIIKECDKRNKCGERGYESVTGSIRERLKHVVGDHLWQLSDSYLAHFLAQTKKAASGKPKVDSQGQATELKREELDY